MKVLIISHEYPYKGNEIRATFVNEQVEELARQGYDVKVISPVPWTPRPLKYLKDKWRIYYGIPKKDTINGIDVYYPRYIALPKNWLLELSGKFMYLGLSKIVNQLHAEGFVFDLIHAHHAVPDGDAAHRLSINYNKPFIVTIHGQDLQHTVYKNEPCVQCVQKVVENANKVIVVSCKLSNIIKKLRFTANVQVLANGIPVLKLNNSEMARHDNSIIILSVSNLIISKGLDLNMKAIAQLINKYPNIKYRIVGAGDNFQALTNLVNVLGIKKNIEFLGLLNHNDVFVEMSKCDIFSLPSWNEGFGVVYIEAMSQGKPVIGCKGEGIEDVIQHGVNGMLVSPKDVESLVDAIDYLVSHPDEANRIGQSGRATIQKDYTWEKIVNRLINLYKQAVQ